jgi:excisionase family DNA binding protein
LPARLKQPGSDQGACVSNCTHLDCLSVKQIASERCRICQERIGYERNYYSESWSFVHEDCLREELAIKTSVKTESIVFLTTDEVANLFRSTTATITQWVSQKRIPYRKVNGKTLFLLEEILHWTVPDKSKKQNREPGLREAN